MSSTTSLHFSLVRFALTTFSSPWQFLHIRSTTALPGPSGNVWAGNGAHKRAIATALRQRIDQQTAARRRLDVRSSGRENADILFAIFTKPTHRNRVDIHSDVRNPEFVTRARIECTEFTIDCRADED